ncbi:hypothetical protein A2U01_0070471, partial [Trifolium medium]|nr:hypothetical protein [Trifolium medium]
MRKLIDEDEEIDRKLIEEDEEMAPLPLNPFWLNMICLRALASMHNVP